MWERDGMKVLVLCSFSSTYVLQLFKYVREYYPDVKYSLFTHISARAYYESHLELSDEENIYSFGNHEYLCGVEAMRLPHFDIVHSLWMERFWGEWAGIFKKKCDVWLCNVGGSDLYRDSSKIVQRQLQQRIIKRADLIISQGIETKDYFNKRYGEVCGNIDHRIIRYGIDILDALDDICEDNLEEIKCKYGIAQGKTVIMCGTNSRIEHQHEAMLNALRSLSEEVRDNIVLLIPMTYGGGTKEYIQLIRNYAESIAETVVLTEFLSTQEMAEITKVTDIMLHVQTTDQLSSVMLAHMYSGNVVIAGSWLPYNELRDKGINFISVNDIEEISPVVLKVLDEPQKYKRWCADNKSKVYAISSWKQSANDWHKAYNDMIYK